jgi:CheY-like chemotaxis protein
VTRILVVEDEGIVARDLQETLQSMGYEVPETCSTGEAAIQAADRLRPDVVLMDIRLAGEMDGTRAAKAIVSRHDCAIVFLTAYADQATVDAAAGSFPYAYLIKPYDEASLRAAMVTALSRLKEDRSRAKRHRQVLDAFEQAVLLADPTGKLTHANLAARRHFPDVDSIQDVLGPDWVDRSGSGRLEISGQPYCFRLQETEGHWAIVVVPQDETASEAAKRTMSKLSERLRELI